MLKQKRLIRIEASLTPKQAVLLWLRQEYKGNTSGEYVAWLVQRPASAAPRSRVERQVADAIRSAMKGQDPNRIHQAVRQAQMQTDFLILLVTRTNSVVLDESRCRWLQIALLYEQIRSSKVSEDEEKALNEWAGRLRDFATELFSLRVASELIRDRYFDGECILLKDTVEGLEQQSEMVRHMMNSYDLVVTEADQPVLATDHDILRLAVNHRASKKADYIVALAKCKMFDDFGEYEAANAVLKPYALRTTQESNHNLNNSVGMDDTDTC